VSTPSSPTMPRLFASLLIVVLGYYFVFSPARELWANYWLLRDGKQGVAVVVKDDWAGHNEVDYRYRVDQKVYTGQDARSWQNPKYAHVTADQESIVYFSASHPWISAINLPSRVMFGGLPVVLFVWVIEIGLIITVVKPNSRWAFDVNGRRGILVESLPRRGPPDSFLLDILQLVGWAILLVFLMGLLAVGVDVLFGPSK
jgi:hypothetical protein